MGCEDMDNWLSEQVGFLPGAVNIGFIRGEWGTYLIDTGIDNSSVNKAVRASGEVTGAIVTHHHADHIGGLNKLEKKGISDLYAPANELDFIRHPSNEPYTMFGGGIPPKLLKNRHLEAKPCKSVRPCTEQNIVEPVPTPGHTIDHHAYLFDGYFFTGDAAFTNETIEKYGLLFAVDPQTAADSANAMRSQKFEQMIPGHGPLQEQRSDAFEVLDATANHYRSTAERVLSILGESLPIKDYIAVTMDQLAISDIVKARGFIQYILYQVPLMGYLSNLLDEQKVQIEMERKGPILRVQ